jgi:hypothetical protein
MGGGAAAITFGNQWGATLGHSLLRQPTLRQRNFNVALEMTERTQVRRAFLAGGDQAAGFGNSMPFDTLAVPFIQTTFTETTTPGAMDPRKSL